jgi:DMSO/TMAO reductase YedYZ molybdopterin-dependent catalytic subunit
MSTRRQVVKYAFAFLGGLAVFFSRVGSGINQAIAETKRRLLKRTTPMSELMHADPRILDPPQQTTTPIQEFDVMGQTAYPVDLDTWRLEVRGGDRSSKEFTYQELLERPLIERNVLLVCSGFFAYNGLWRGFSVAELLKEIGMPPGITHVKFSGPGGFGRKTRKFTIDEVMRDKIFIAYGVNGQILPERHGFPMRLVAEDRKGWRWVKYLNRLTVISK